MKFSIIFIVLACCQVTVMSQSINIIPMPQQVKMKTGLFTVSPATVIVADEDEDNSVNFLNDYLKNCYGFTLKRVKSATSNFIRLSTKRMLLPGTEGKYDLTAIPASIIISGDTRQGTFYGVQSFLQLLPPTSFESGEGKLLKIPCVEINDEPRFQYRGLMLDVCRHFFPVSFVKKYIDYIAMFKLNTFHWHLTDDQGWRIEIKRYPKLTSVGGFRNGTIIGRYPGTANDNQNYGGFYTQEEIKEVVQYAADRYITVIPEIEMPGHASAAIAAYPELSCFPSEPTNLKAHGSNGSKQAQSNGNKKMVQETFGVFEDVFCPSDTTFQFLENVLAEVMPLFPSKLVHIGGDEAPKEAWKKSAFCQQLIKDKGLKDEHGLQSYFITRIEKYINSKGKQIIGWDEILEGGLAPNATVMSWRGEQGGIDAAKQGHDVVMTPGGFLYFDHSQTKNEDSVTIGGYLPLEQVYSYNPIPASLSADQAKHILGAQANLWTEYIANGSKVQYMIFPRLAALAEILWTKTENKNWDAFQKRLPTFFKRLDNMKINYSKAYFDLKATVIPTKNNKGVSWNLESKRKDLGIQYRKINDNTRSMFVPYSTPITVEKNTQIQALLGLPDKPMGNILMQDFIFNTATGKKITLKENPSPNYPGSGAFTLVDGVQNTKGLAASVEFIGYNGKDCEATIDFGQPTTIRSVAVHFFELKDSWIYAPQSVAIAASNDNATFASLSSTNTIDTAASGNGKIIIETVANEPKQNNYRYLKITVKNFGMIPSGMAGASNPAWLFLDEVEVM